MLNSKHLFVIFRFREFEEDAIIATKELFSLTHECLDCVFLMHIIPYYEESILSLGYFCNCKLYVAAPGVQTVLDKIWRNNLNSQATTNIGISKDLYFNIKVSHFCFVLYIKFQVKILHSLLKLLLSSFFILGIFSPVTLMDKTGVANELVNEYENFNTSRDILTLFI